ncbi:hypothetical protein NFI96_011480 [Prochilodus magdalenae]|nr:hypothetical protein NFI96_011480 [Prochilodus magdalenae]
MKYKTEGTTKTSTSLYSFLPETAETQLAKHLTEIQSELKYKEGKKSLSRSLYSTLPETTEMQFAREITAIISENKYKENSMRAISSSIYSQLPETTETHFAKALSELHSETKYKEVGKKLVSSSLYSKLPETLQTQHAKAISHLQSEVMYKEAKKENAHNLYSLLPETMETKFAKQMSIIQNEVMYKEAKKENAHNLYSLLPETMETKFAKQMSIIQNEEEQDELCQSPTAVNVSDQTIRNRPYEGDLRARCPVVGPVLTGQHRRAGLAFATEHQNWQIRHRRLVLFTDESRFYLSTCDRRDRLWRRRGECYAACNIIQHDWFGGGSVMVWGGISLEGRTDLYRLDNSTLTGIRYQDEILGPVARPYAGAVGPGFLLVHNNAQPHVAKVCRQFMENEGIDTIDWSTGFPDLNPLQHLWDIMFRSIRCHQVAFQTVQELSDALVQIWEEIPRTPSNKYMEKVKKSSGVSIYSHLPETPETQFAKAVTELQSENKYKKVGKEKMGNSFYSVLPKTLETQHAKQASDLISEVCEGCVNGNVDCVVSGMVLTAKYKEASKKQAPSSVYSQLPETPETKHAKEVSQLQSENKYKNRGKQNLSSSLYSKLPYTTETQFAAKISDLLSKTKYKEETKRSMSSNIYSLLPETTVTQLVKMLSHMQSESKYMQAGQRALSSAFYCLLPKTLATQHAKEVSQLLSKTKYKEKSKTEMSSCLYSLLPKTIETQFAKAMSELQSETKYRQKGKEALSTCSFSHLPQTYEMQFAKEMVELQSEYKYKQEGKKKLANCLYALLPKTRETQHGKELSQLYSKKSYEEKWRKDAAACIYARMPQTVETAFAKEVNKHQSDVCKLVFAVTSLQNVLIKWQPHVHISQKLYKKNYCMEKGKSVYAYMKTLPEVDHATEINRQQSNVIAISILLTVYSPAFLKYHCDSLTSCILVYLQIACRNKVDIFNKQSLLRRSDIVHAMEVAKIASQVHYKQKSNKEKPQYSPSECVSFKHLQAASALASQVQYRKKYEQAKGQYHFTLDTAEQLHHKANAVLHSQIKYIHEYEKNKDKVKMEFVETQFYRLSKETQKMQSEKEYRKEYDNCIKGKALVDVELTPGYLIARNANSLLSEKAYKKDLELEVKGKGLNSLEEIPELLRVKNAKKVLSETEYRKDLKNEIIGKGISTDTMEMQRAKKASEMTSQICVYVCLGCVFLFQLPYKQLSQLSHSSFGTVTDTPELLHAAYLKDIYSQKKYKDNAVKLRCSYAVVPDTPEIERVKTNQRNISSVMYTWDAKFMKGLMSSVTETPEIVLAKENAKKISNVQYKEKVGSGTSVRYTPEMERVRRNQETISPAKYHDQTRWRGCTPALKNQNMGHAVGMDRNASIHVDQKVWRTDPDSIFDFDPVEDNIQSKSLQRISERANCVTRQQSAHFMPSCTQSASSSSEFLADESVSVYSNTSTLQDTASTGNNHPTSHHYLQQPLHQHAYAHIHQTNIKASPHSATMRVYRALYDYAAQDLDEVSFQDGDVLINVQPVDEGWMYGTVQRTQKSGMIPANYVEIN